MVSDPGHRSHVARIAGAEARRRFASTGKVAAIVFIAVLATLAFTRHRFSPECVRALVCFERTGR